MKSRGQYNNLAILILEHVIFSLFVLQTPPHMSKTAMEPDVVVAVATRNPDCLA